MNIIVDASPDAPRGGNTTLELKNGVGPDARNNIFIIDGQGPAPALRSSVVGICEESLPVFRRGDVDGNGNVDLSDAVAILSFLFLGGRAPSCMDAADTDDTERIDLADAIGLLSFLFLGGNQPAVPFPGVGIDPKGSDLPPCSR
jgi:hypothetical protein